MKKRENGITLVALVITIIILLILAGIAIAGLGGENGLIGKVNQAKQAQIKAEMKEKLTLSISELQTEKEGKSTLDDIIQEWADNTLEEYNSTITNDASISGKKITMQKSGITGKYIIDENLNITEIEENSSNIEFSYDIYERVDNKVKILIHVQDKENGLARIEFPDEAAIIIEENKNEKKEINYQVEIGTEYKIKIISENGATNEEKILITDYWHNITKKLGEGIEIDNPAVKAEYNKPYQATIKAMDGYEIGDIVVKMGEELVTVDKTTGIINIENVTGDIEIIAIAGNGIIIAVGDTNADTGEVILNLERYVDQAESGNTIYIPEGEYKLAQINSYHSYAINIQCGINDKGKNLTFVGDNEKTKLIYYGGESSKSNGNSFMCLNNTTIIRNMIIEFYPGKNNYLHNALFSHTYGNVYNTFFIVKNTNQPTCYGYNNMNYLNVNIENCDIYFEDTSLVNASYLWSSSNYGMKFNNIVSNYLPREYTSINNSVECDINENIEDTKNNENIVNNGVGVYYGDYAW